VILAGLAPLAVRGMKRTIVELSRGALDAEAARARIAACFASDDHAEGLAAQREKRPPQFEGR
jgi:enoyl-CoA hydratase/carnithine racemase